MERAFGTDFSAVRIHQGPEATALGAVAYAQGDDIHFAPGQYDPVRQHGQELLDHELTPRRPAATGMGVVGPAGDGLRLNSDATLDLEREADDLGARAARGETVASSGPPAGATAQPGAVQRKKINLPGRGVIETKGYTYQQLQMLMREYSSDKETRNKIRDVLEGEDYDTESSTSMAKQVEKTSDKAVRNRGGSNPEPRPWSRRMATTVPKGLVTRAGEDQPRSHAT
jgi:hypothetical protein